jgi:hypothetical protein
MSGSGRPDGWAPIPGYGDRHVHPVDPIWKNNGRPFGPPACLHRMQVIVSG